MLIVLAGFFGAAGGAAFVGTAGYFTVRDQFEDVSVILEESRQTIEVVSAFSANLDDTALVGAVNSLAAAAEAISVSARLACEFYAAELGREIPPICLEPG